MGVMAIPLKSSHDIASVQWRKSGGKFGGTTLLVVQILKVWFTKLATIKHLTQLKTSYI